MSTLQFVSANALLTGGSLFSSLSTPVSGERTTAAAATNTIVVMLAAAAVEPVRAAIAANSLTLSASKSYLQRSSTSPVEMQLTTLPINVVYIGKCPFVWLSASRIH